LGDGDSPAFFNWGDFNALFLENLLKSLKIDTRLENLNLLKIVFGILT